MLLDFVMLDLGVVGGRPPASQAWKGLLCANACAHGAGVGLPMLGLRLHRVLASELGGPRLLDVI